MIIRATAMLAAACVLGGATSAMAAPFKHRRSTHWAVHHHALARSHARIQRFEPRFNPYAYGFQPFAYGFRPGSAAEERWFDQAKGNIW